MTVIIGRLYPATAKAFFSRPRTASHRDGYQTTLMSPAPLTNAWRKPDRFSRRPSRTSSSGRRETGA